MSRHVLTELPLSTAFRVRRRYSRSVNLERDLTVAGSLDGYIVSRLAIDATERVFHALRTPGMARAWTVTGVYGTGKSAFAHFLCSLAAPKGHALRTDALRLLGAADGGELLASRLRSKLPANGFIRAVVTAQREPLATTVLRALWRGVELERQSRARWRPGVAEEIRRLLQKALDGGRPLPGDRIVGLLRRLADVSDGGVLIVIDELGKSLEHAARELGAEDDLYLLQQLAEATAEPGPPIGVVGLLHQGFGEYGAALALERRSEWLKIQGRYEDIVFAQPPEQMLRLISSALELRGGPELTRSVRREAVAWRDAVAAQPVDQYVREALTAELISGVLPLHPISALVLPSLCARYGQNDRSLFTFLASQEPHAFGRFLRERSFPKGVLPLQRLDDVYDYFAGIAGQSLGFRPHFARWAEVHAVVNEARSLDPDSGAAVKVVAALNLGSASGPLRASRGLVALALAESPPDARANERWRAVLDRLVERGILTYRTQLDEYRLWEGSDFDVEAAIRERAAHASTPLAAALESAIPLAPAVAQRHSYRTGTLRYFERRYVDTPEAIAAPECALPESDGLALYWVGREMPPEVPPMTSEGRPIIVVQAAGVRALGDAVVEYAALEDIGRSEPHLQTDGVARREVRHRLRVARTILERVLREALFGAPLRCVVAGRVESLTARQLRVRLSDVCDVAFPLSGVLWNELINRRELTSQGARARRELISAMLARGDRERLGLEGGGPETSMYDAVLGRTGIHRRDGDRWRFGPPEPGSGLEHAWAAITEFCHGAVDRPRGIDELFALLERPPYGMKRGVLPVLLAAVLLADADTLSVYREGSFIPTLGAEHFEVLVKHPAKFSVKHFALDGLRAEVFADLEEIVRAPGAHAPTTRNSTILGVVRPLVRFAATLPPTTLKTQGLSPTALAVRDALLNAREPDHLLFVQLPCACGLTPVAADEAATQTRRAEFSAALLTALRELQTHLDRRRSECHRLLHVAFGVSEDPQHLRADLTRRAHGVLNRPLEERLRAFIAAAGNDSPSDDEWLDALVVVVSDRPLRTWTDQDAATFEGRLAEIARRLANLEAVQAAGLCTPDADIRRIGVTRADGTDHSRVVTIPNSRRGWLEARAEELAGQLAKLPASGREAVLALLTELVLDGTTKPTLPSHSVHQLEPAGSSAATALADTKHS